MFSKVVQYEDHNGNAREESLHFHIMAPEFVDLEFNPTFEGGLGNYVQEAMRSGDGQKVYTFFKLLIVNSYGRRSADGAEFDKDPAWTEKFLNSLAYESFFLWLVDDPKNAETFFNGIMPKKLLEKAKEAQLESKKDPRSMSLEELQAAYQAKLLEKKPANEL